MNPLYLNESFFAAFTRLFASRVPSVRMPKRPNSALEAAAQAKRERRNARNLRIAAAGGIGMQRGA